MISVEDLKNQLAEKFRKCNMVDDKQRDAILALIPQSISSSISRSSTPNIDISYIISSCLTFQNGIEILTIAVYRVEGETSAWCELRDFVRDYFTEIATMQNQPEEAVFCTYIDRKYLWALAADIPLTIGDLEVACRNSTPNRQKPLQHSRPLDMLEGILEYLAKHRFTQGKAHPLLKFVEWLAFYADKYGKSEIRAKLQFWVKGSADLSQLEENQLTALRDKIRQKNVVSNNGQDSTPSSYLLIELFDDEAIPNSKTRVKMRKYNVQAWIFDDKHKKGIQVNTEIKGKLTEIEASIGGLLDQCPFNNPIIEFLVPDELLSYEFDYWKIKTNEGVSTLGLTYRVVVRSAKRLTIVVNSLFNKKDMQAKMRIPIAERMRQCLGNWQIKWDHFQAFEKHHHSKNFACICDLGKCKLAYLRLHSESSCSVLVCGREECQKHGSLEAALMKSPIVCLAVRHAPLSEPASKYAATFPLFETLRLTGMPIALWPRNGVDTELLISSLLYFPLSELPNKIMEWRKDAVIGEKEQIPGKHLTLLWDDPSRLPPNLIPPTCKAPAKGV